MGGYFWDVVRIVCLIFGVVLEGFLGGVEWGYRW